MSRRKKEQTSVFAFAREKMATFPYIFQCKICHPTFCPMKAYSSLDPRDLENGYGRQAKQFYLPFQIRF
ncbi:MAG: hypothetical protein AMJ89_05410 [candidate division Zixibacteria bacterium SM23_73]|nr:MAG: hypothetical protein AMJ89_05410 [candidate division Zixibacteria bacterium SM23_73]